MKQTYLAAFAVAAAFALWLLSGVADSEGDREPAPALSESRQALLAQEQDAPVRVRARLIPAQPQTDDVVVRGRTEADRTVTVRAETAGRVVDLPVERGERVDAGDLLCRVAVDAREARLEEARQSLAQARIDYEGALKLRERGLQSESAIASSLARVAATQAELAQRELDLRNTRIVAPFAGVVETRPVEVGDFLQTGSVCATVVDADPIMLVGEASEIDVARLASGQPGYGRLITGEDVTGEVTFVATAANPSTRTFRLEVAVPNPEGALRDGITAQIRVPVRTLPAHRVPSAILALDDAGDVGLRILDEDDVVHFVNVDIVKDDGQGIWVRGLPDPAKVITVGQELVTEGRRVEVTLEADTLISRGVDGSGAANEETTTGSDSSELAGQPPVSPAASGTGNDQGAATSPAPVSGSAVAAALPGTR